MMNGSQDSEKSQNAENTEEDKKKKSIQWGWNVSR